MGGVVGARPEGALGRKPILGRRASHGAAPFAPHGTAPLIALQRFPCDLLCASSNIGSGSGKKTKLPVCCPGVFFHGRGQGRCPAPRRTRAAPRPPAPHMKAAAAVCVGRKNLESEHCCTHHELDCVASVRRTDSYLALLMASPSGSSRGARAPPPVPPPVAPSNAAGAPVDTTLLDTLCEKALAAGNSGRYALAAGFYRRGADEALRLHGDTFVCTHLTLWRALLLRCQAQLEGVPPSKRWRL